MMYCDYIWDLLSLLAGAIIVYRIAKKGRQLIKPLRFSFFMYWLSYGDITSDSYAYW